jgi:hypothetical protein
MLLLVFFPDSGGPPLLCGGALFQGDPIYWHFLFFNCLAQFVASKLDSSYKTH